MKLTEERLRAMLHYDPITGVMTWIAAPHCHRELYGHVAGQFVNGYCTIKIDGVKYRRGRLAFLYMLGRFPSCIDHINCQPR